MNWYKISQNIERLIANDIITWLDQAYYGNADLAMLDDDISMRMSGIDDIHSLSRAIEYASGIVSEKQNGSLNEAQNYIISMLKQRIM